MSKILDILKAIVDEKQNQYNMKLKENADAWDLSLAYEALLRDMLELELRTEIENVPIASPLYPSKGMSGQEAESERSKIERVLNTLGTRKRVLVNDDPLSEVKNPPAEYVSPSENSTEDSINSKPSRSYIPFTKEEEDRAINNLCIKNLKCVLEYGHKGACAIHEKLHRHKFSLSEMKDGISKLNDIMCQPECVLGLRGPHSGDCQDYEGNKLRR